MKFKSSVLALLSLIIAAPVLAGEQFVKLSVPGMSCPSCPYIIEAVIGEVNGVLYVLTDAYERSAEVFFDDELTTVEAIQAATLDVGFETSLFPENG